MDPDVRALITVVEKLVYKIDDLSHKVEGLLCHFSSVDADYVRMRDTVQELSARVSRLERAHDIEPMEQAGSHSALVPAIQTPKKD